MVEAPEGKFMSTIRVGPKGQIVIPKQVRELLDIKLGDNVLLLADRERGIAILPQQLMPNIPMPGGGGAP
jgi:AbrB family looped-hinge helix DNA binding protein